MQANLKNLMIPIVESGHRTRLKLELQKEFPGQRLYFITDYVRPGNLRTPVSDQWNIRDQTDEIIYKIDPLHLEEIKNHKAFLVLEMWMESGEGFIYWLYKKCIKANIPTERVILIGSSFDYKDISIKYANENNVTPINNVYYSYFERYTKRQLLLDKCENVQLSDTLYKLEASMDLKSLNIPNPLVLNNFEKKYIFLNHITRPHRQALVTLLHSQNLLDQGYVSFLNNTTGFKKSDVFSFITEYFDEPIRTMLKEGKDVDQLFPLKLDHVPSTAKSMADPGLMSNNPIEQYILSSFLHVIGETFFGTKDTWINTFTKGECVFVTEKIIKAIRFKQPFIVVSYPNTLDAIRKLGYKTFDGIIDESYDKEMDDTKRMHKILLEIKRICELDEDTFEDYRQKLIPIVEYNFDIFLNKKDFLYKL